MIGQYDHFSHPLFLYCTKSKSCSSKHGFCMMGFGLGFWWFKYCIFSSKVTTSKTSMSKKREMKHFKGLILVVIALVLLIFLVILAFTYCTWVFRSHSIIVLPTPQPQALWKQSDSSDFDWVLNVWINSYSITFLIWNMNLIFLQNQSVL